MSLRKWADGEKRRNIPRHNEQHFQKEECPRKKEIGGKWLADKVRDDHKGGTCSHWLSLERRPGRGCWCRTNCISFISNVMEKQRMLHTLSRCKICACSSVTSSGRRDGMGAHLEKNS